MYVDIGVFAFDRRTEECNFLFSKTDITTESAFTKTNCVRPDNSICNVLNNVFDKTETSIIYYLMQVMIGNIKGGRKRPIKGGTIKDDGFLSDIIGPISRDRPNIEDKRVIDDESDVTGSIAVIINIIEYTTVIIRLDKKLYDTDEYKQKLEKDIKTLCALLDDQYEKITKRLVAKCFVIVFYSYYRLSA